MQSSQKFGFRNIISGQKNYIIAILPAIIVALIFQYFPIYGVVAAFQEFDIIKGYFHSPFVGFSKFKELFGATEFWTAFIYTLKISVLRYVLSIIIPVTFALLLFEISNKFLKKLVQNISYLPYFLSWVIVGGLIYRFLDIDGPLNHILKSLLNVDPIQFVANSAYFIPMVILSDLWKNTGYAAILYIAALSSIDPQLYEAAKIDGAGRLKVTRHITLPGITPTIIMVSILSIASIVTMGIDQVYNLQNSLIRSDTHVLDTYIMYIGLERANYSFGVASGLFQAVLSTALLLGTNFLSQKASGVGLYKS